MNTSTDLSKFYYKAKELRKSLDHPFHENIVKKPDICIIHIMFAIVKEIDSGKAIDFYTNLGKHE
jgi:hypothetical protein